MVSNASEDLPDPDRPVITVSESRGITTSTFLRLCSRAPRTWMLPALGWAMNSSCPLLGMSVLRMFRCAPRCATVPAGLEEFSTHVVRICLGARGRIDPPIAPDAGQLRFRPSRRQGLRDGVFDAVDRDVWNSA